VAPVGADHERRACAVAAGRRHAPIREPDLVDGEPLAHLCARRACRVDEQRVEQVRRGL
jgi:hypothetical protein